MKFLQRMRKILFILAESKVVLIDNDVTFDLFEGRIKPISESRFVLSRSCIP